MNKVVVQEYIILMYGWIEENFKNKRVNIFLKNFQDTQSNSHLNSRRNISACEIYRLSRSPASLLRGLRQCCPVQHLQLETGYAVF